MKSWWVMAWKVTHPRQSWILDSTPWISDSGFKSSVGFRVPWAVLWIPKSRISETTSKNFSNRGIRIPLHGARNGKETVSDDFYTTKTYRAPQIIQLNPRWYCRNNKNQKLMPLTYVFILIAKKTKTFKLYLCWMIPTYQPVIHVEMSTCWRWSRRLRAKKLKSGIPRRKEWLENMF